jgi:5,10-methylenetetrahydromethanopterin reductase
MFATSVATPEHIARAEQLGYQYAFVYDSPSIYADPWMALARAADRTSRIQLGVAVITPRLRHVVASACALATLNTVAPGRTLVVVGVGFTSQLMLGQKPARWGELSEFVSALRTLLKGDELLLDDHLVGLFHSPRTGVKLPATMPVWVAANGPKGLAVADSIGEVVLTSARPAKPVKGKWAVTLHGVVLETGESIESESVLASAGPAAAFALHRTSEDFGAQFPEARRHIETHRAHLIDLTPTDRQFVTPEVIRRTTFTGQPEEVKSRLEGLEQAGVETVLYQPAGDIPRRLEGFAKVAIGN